MISYCYATTVTDQTVFIAAQKYCFLSFLELLLCCWAFFSFKAKAESHNEYHKQIIYLNTDYLWRLQFLSSSSCAEPFQSLFAAASE